MKSKNPADNLLLERFTRRIPGFNERQQTCEDLIFLCDVLDIYFDFMDLSPVHGCSFVEQGDVFLFVSSHLPPSLRVIAGFHELAHILDHPLNAHELHRSTGHLWNLDKLERQAQTVGVVALMPKPLIENSDVFDVMGRFEVPFDIATFRLSLPF